MLMVTAAVLVLGSCAGGGMSDDGDWTLSQPQRDSVAFGRSHHYNTGYNFVLRADSMVLAPEPKGWHVSLDYMHEHGVLHKGDDFVVAEVFRPEGYDSLGCDSVWVRVGTDGVPLGWVEEKVMLERSTPTNPISRFIAGFSDTHLFVFCVVLALAVAIAVWKRHKGKRLRVFCFNDMGSAYAKVYMVTIILTALIYVCLRLCQPDLWDEYYFNPSLNPLGQPVTTGLFLALVWLSVIMLLSVIYDLFEKVSLSELTGYIVVLLAWGGVIIGVACGIVRVAL